MTPQSSRAALERLLEAHAAADAGEREHLSRIREFVARYPDPLDRAILEGHLTGSAFVIDPAGRLLLTHHRKLGIWVQLGGHAGGERRAEAVALREASEESGLDDLAPHAALRFEDGTPRLLDVDVHAIPAHGGDRAHEHFDLRFLFVTQAPERVRRDPGESKALEWVSIATARARCDAGIRRAVAKIEALLAHSTATSRSPR